MKPQQPKLAPTFEDQAKGLDPLDASEYQAVLEDLLHKGTGFGKTETVAAYLLRDLRLVDGKSSPANATAAFQSVAVEPLYVVMDTRHWPNEYARSLVLQDMMIAYVRRVTGEEDLNHPDFNGSGIWTSRKASFEGDYKRQDGLNDQGRRTNLYNPDPEAYRLCLRAERAMVIPTRWGTYPVKAGGTLAIREKDVPALAAALRSVKSGAQTAEEALYDTDANGKTIARFDVYGMEPTFLENNYNPVPLKPATRALMDAVMAEPSASKNGRRPR